MSDHRDRWNHNIHHHPVILDAVPSGAQRALDIGCGEGLLARQLADVVPDTVGIDTDRASIDLAQQQAGPGQTYIHGDLFTHPFEPESFDIVVSVAMIHHVDAETGLERMKELTRPGGTIALVGLARTRLPRDIPWELAGAVTTRVLKLSRTYWEHSAPTVWPPPTTHHEIRDIARRTLPGVHHRRHVLWRYSLVWTKPVRS